MTSSLLPLFCALNPQNKNTNKPKGGHRNSTITGSGSIDTECGIYSFQLISTNVNTANVTATSSKSGSGKASGVSYCMVTGSVLLGVAAFFGSFL